MMQLQACTHARANTHTHTLTDVLCHLCRHWERLAKAIVTMLYTHTHTHVFTDPSSYAVMSVITEAPVLTLFA